MLLSKRLLIHNAILKQKNGRIDRDRNALYESGELRKVRIGVTRRVQSGAHGIIRADTMTLFIVPLCSEYFKDGQRDTLVIPRENDVIVFEGKEYTVKGVTPCYGASGKASHYEAVLE